MEELEYFVYKCELNMLSAQQINADLHVYRQNLPLFIEALIRLSDKSVLAFIMLKNEIKQESDPNLFLYVLSQLYAFKRVPAPLCSEVVFICCQKLNEIPEAVVEHCKRSSDLYLISRLLNLHCKGVEALHEFIDVNLEMLFKARPQEAVEALIYLQSVVFYRRYFQALLVLLNSESERDIAVRACAQILAEFYCLVMQNRSHLIGIVLAAFEASDIGVVGRLINSAFMTPAMLQIIEECSSQDQKYAIFDSSLRLLAKVYDFDNSFDNGAYLLLQALQQFIRQSYDIYRSRVDFVQAAFEHEIGNVLNGASQTQLQIAAALFSSFPLDSVKYEGFAHQIVELLTAQRFTAHFSSSTAVYLVGVLITLSKAHTPSRDIIAKFFCMATQAPTEGLAVALVNLLNTSVMGTDEELSEEFYSYFCQLCTAYVQRWSNSPLFMSALSGFAQELIRRCGRVCMGPVIIQLIDFLLSRERISAALSGATRLLDEELDAYTMGFELMEAAVLSRAPEMIDHAHYFVAGVAGALSRGVASGEFDYDAMENVLRVADELSQVDSSFLDLFKALEPALCALAAQDIECSRYCCMILGGYCDAMQCENVRALTYAALDIFRNNIWTYSGVELAYFLEKTICADNPFNSDILELTGDILSDSYAYGYLTEQVACVFIKISQFLDVRQQFARVAQNLCLAVGEIVAGWEAVMLYLFDMYKRFYFWEVQEFRTALWEICSPIDLANVEDQTLRYYITELAKCMK